MRLTASGSSHTGRITQHFRCVAAHGGNGEADDGPEGKASVEAFHTAGEDSADADHAEDVACGLAFHDARILVRGKWSW